MRPKTQNMRSRFWRIKSVIVSILEEKAKTVRVFLHYKFTNANSASHSIFDVSKLASCSKKAGSHFFFF